MNKRKIQTLSFWTTSGVKQADHFMLYNFHRYNFDGSPSMVSYKLGYLEQVGENPEYFVSLYEGTVSLPDAVVQEWGADDEPIFDYVKEELNLEYDND